MLFAEFFNAIVNAFSRLVETIKGAPGASFFAMLMCLALYVAYTNNSKLEQLIDTPKSNSDHFQSAVGISNDIDAAIQNLVDSTAAKGVLVRQFHNGKKDLTGLPFTYVSTTYISLADERIKIDKSEFESYPVSTGTFTFGEMWVDFKNPKCITRKLDDVKDPVLRHSLRSYDFRYVTMCPLTNLLKYPMGVMVVGYEAAPTGDQIGLATQMSREVTGYLVSIQDNDKKSFVEFVFEIFGF